ncbi:hypothetical protein BH10PLA2_BH10PLA2_15520 [soil metagenome]
MEQLKASIRKHIVRLTQAEAEIRFLVRTSSSGEDLHVRGRLMGPRCPYSSTVEVAYPLKEIERTSDAAGQTSILLRTIIPEPSMWDPQSPFLYSGPVGIWQRDQVLEQHTMQVGFVGWGLGTRGLRVNGQYTNLQAAVVGHLDPETCASLRDKQVNCLVVDVRDSTPSVWELTDRFGFFVLGRLHSIKDWEQARALEGRPSSLGWILKPEAVAGYKPRDIDGTTYTGSAPIIGLETGEESAPVPPGISFRVSGTGPTPSQSLETLPWLRMERLGEKATTDDLADGILGTLRNWPPVGEVRL